ncbi:MAG: phosphonate C-P lyase system protein PhnL [Burkholderiaceae bacterium]
MITLDPARPVVLAVRSLHKRFTLHLRDARVLDVLESFSMRVEPGRCAALAGPSGRGKSTILKCLAGNYRIDGGEVCLEQDGRKVVDLARASDQTMIRLRRSVISNVSQFLRVVPRVPALDVVAERCLEGLPPMSDAEHAEHLANARERAAELLERLRVPQALWSLPPATFSGGEQQRVNIARGFVRATPLLLLDEPTASLDNANRDIVIELIVQAKAAGRTVVGIFHDEAVRAAVADDIVTV